MAGSTKTLTIEITAENRKALGALQQTVLGLDGVEKKAKTSQSELAKWAGNVAIGYVAKQMLDASEQADKAQRATAASIKSTGNAAHESAAQQDELTKKMSEQIGVNHTVVSSAADLLRSYTNVQNIGSQKIFDQTLKSSADVAVAWGTDLPGAVSRLGEAVNDPEHGLRSLRGLGFSQDDLDRIKQLSQSGDRLGAQMLILNGIQQRFGGQAGANATATDKFKVSLQNVEEVGGKAFEPLVHGATDILTEFTKLPGPIQDVALGLGALAVLGPKVVSGLSFLKDAGSWAKGVGQSGLGGLEKGLSGVESAAGGLTPALGVTAGAVVGVSAVVALGTSIYKEYEQEKEKVRVATANLTQALKDEQGGQKDAVATTLASALAADKYGAMAVKAGASTKTLVDGIKDNHHQLKILRDAWKAALAPTDGGDLPKLEKQLHDTGLEGTALGDQLLRLRKTMNPGDFEGLLEALYRQSNGFKNATTDTALHSKALDGLKASTRGARDETVLIGQDSNNAANEQVALRSKVDSLTESWKKQTDALEKHDQEITAGLTTDRALITATQTRADAAQALADAQQAANGNSDEYRQAQQAIADAEKNVAQAQESATQAQQDLNQARVDAVQRIHDMQRAAEDAVLSKRDAELGLREAELALQQGIANPQLSGLDKDKLQLAVDEAKQKLAEAGDAANKAATDAAAAQRAGVDGDKNVIDAKKKVADANQNVTDSEGKVADATKAAAKVIADAKKTASDATKTYQQAILDEATAADEAATAHGGVAAGIEAHITALDRLAQMLDPSSPFRQNLQSYIALLYGNLLANNPLPYSNASFYGGAPSSDRPRPGTNPPPRRLAVASPSVTIINQGTPRQNARATQDAAQRAYDMAWRTAGAR